MRSYFWVLSQPLPPCTVGKLSPFLSLPVGVSPVEGGWGGAKSYDREKTGLSVNHLHIQCCSGVVLIVSTGNRIFTVISKLFIVLQIWYARYCIN
jgi:hypothetical protein